MPKVIFQPMNKTVEVETGTNLLEAAHENEVDLEGACECSLACSTCHVVIDQKWFDKLEPASDEEEDILDKAWEVTPTSRLGCQVEVTDDLDGIEVTIPEYTVNVSVDKK